MSFSASRLYLEAALNELLSVVYVCVGVGWWVGVPEGVTLKLEMKSLYVSCHCGEKPARQLHRGPRET